MLVFPFDGQVALARSVSQKLQHLGDRPVELAQFEHRHFPDGETYIRVDSDVKNQDIIIMCQLHQPNDKAVGLMYLSESLRQLGARSIGLLAPYLSYMRQDKKFRAGECVTSRHFARWISERFDWLVTVDPHLHRYSNLNDIYTIPSYSIHATGAIAKYLKQQVTRPLIIGPDAESEQWANAVAANANCPALVLKKIRRGDRQVEVSLPELSDYSDHQPVLVDDIISTGKTMIETAANIVTLGGKIPICIGVHAVFAPGAYAELRQANIAKIVTCNTISHDSNQIDISELLVQSILDI